MSTLPKSLVTALQGALINAGYDINSKTGKPDGVLGNATMRSLSHPAVMGALSESIAAAKLPPAPLANHNLVSRQELDAYISVVALWARDSMRPKMVDLMEAMDEDGISVADYLSYIVTLEAAQPRAGMFDPMSISPSGLHFGLAQIGLPAWTDAVGVDPALPAAANSDELRAYAFNPEMNLKAAVLVAAANWGYTLDKVRRGSIRKPVAGINLLYFMHNLGHTVVNTLATGRIQDSRLFGLQSERAKAEYVRVAPALKRELMYG